MFIRATCVVELSIQSIAEVGPASETSHNTFQVESASALRVQVNIFHIYYAYRSMDMDNRTHKLFLPKSDPLTEQALVKESPSLAHLAETDDQGIRKKIYKATTYNTLAHLLPCQNFKM